MVGCGVGQPFKRILARHVAAAIGFDEAVRLGAGEADLRESDDSDVVGHRDEGRPTRMVSISKYLQVRTGRWLVNFRLSPDGKNRGTRT